MVGYIHLGTVIRINISFGGAIDRINRNVFLGKPIPNGSTIIIRTIGVSRWSIGTNLR